MPGQGRGDTFVGVLARRGRFAVAEPLFERGRQVSVDLRKRGEAALGDIVLLAPAGGRTSRATSSRRCWSTAATSAVSPSRSRRRRNALRNGTIGTTART
jgi:hypothetical protein